jgi:hypothetical protein
MTSLEQNYIHFKNLGFDVFRGAQYLTGEKAEVAWAEFSTLS